MKIRRVVLLILLALFLLFVHGAQAASGIPDPYPLPSLTGNYRDDLVAVANSQLGYAEAPDGSNYFAYWYDPSNPTADWCTEFFDWCAAQAHIPASIVPKASAVHSLQGFYLTQGRFYFLTGGITESLAGMTGIETISIEDARPGDILLTESYGNPENGPDHVAIFLSCENGKARTISGNCGNKVAIMDFPLSRIHCICRPAYEGGSVIKRKYTCTLPDTVTSIPDLNYRDIENLYDFHMGSQVSSIGRASFRGCVNLKMHCDSLTLSHLGESAFYNASAPRKVSLEMKTVPRLSFYQARDLQEVSFSAGKVAIEEYAFCRASDLKKLIFSRETKSIQIANNAFSGCRIDTIEIPSSVRQIQGTFSSSAIWLVEKGSYAEEFARKHGYKVKYLSDEPGEVTVKDGVYKVYPDQNNAVFCRPAKNSLTSLTVQDTVKLNGKKYKVTAIEDGACKGLSKLKKLTIGKNITEIGAEAFKDCAKLKTITIKSDKLQQGKIGKKAFEGINPKATVKCPEKMLEAYQEYLLASGIPESAVFKAK